MAELLALHVHVGQDPVEPARQRPGAAAEQGHHRRDDGHPDDERVEEHGGGETQADRLDQCGVAEDEPGEHGDHDDRSRRDHSGPVAEPGDYRLLRFGPVDVLLPHPGHQEDLVAHGEAEHDADHEDRQNAHDGRGLVDTQEAREPSPLEDGYHDAEGGEDGEEESGGGLEGDEDRAEDQHQQDQGQAHDDAQVRDQGVVELVRQIDVDRGRPGDHQLGAGVTVQGGASVANVGDQVDGLPAVGELFGTALIMATSPVALKTTGLTEATSGSLSSRATASAAAALGSSLPRASTTTLSGPL